MKHIKQTYDLIDSFRYLYKNEKSYTWSCESTGVRTRLDRIYVNKHIKNEISNVSHTSCNVSDHLGVIIEFNSMPKSKFKIGKGIWKFNT